MNGFGDFLSLGAGGLEDDAFGDCLKQKKAAGKWDVCMFIHGFDSTSEMSLSIFYSET